MKVALATVALVAFVAFQGPTAPQPAPQPAGSSTGFFNNGDVRLSYRLDLPGRDRPAPAIVFGHGSGRATKSSCRFLADSFLQRGYATLCFDKRGVGESSGEYSNVGIENSNAMLVALASDLAAPPLETLHVPGLWLLGGADRSIPTPATAAILDRLAQTGRPFTHVVFEGAGHDLSGAPIWRHIDFVASDATLVPPIPKLGLNGCRAKGDDHDSALHVERHSDD